MTMPGRWAWVQERGFCHAFSIKQSFLGEYLRKQLEVIGVLGEAISLGPSSKENRDDQNRENVHDLDHWIDRRTGGVLVRIPDRITGNCGLLREGTFASKIA